MQLLLLPGLFFAPFLAVMCGGTNRFLRHTMFFIGVYVSLLMLLGVSAIFTVIFTGGKSTDTQVFYCFIGLLSLSAIRAFCSRKNINKLWRGE